MKRITLAFPVLAFLLLSAVSAYPAAIDNPVVIDNVPNVIGVAGASVPDYVGSDDYKFVAAPFLKLTWGQRYIQLQTTQINVNLINHPVLRFGPSLNYHIGRSDDVEDEVVEKMEEIEDTLEAGAFLGVQFMNASNPRQRFIASLDFLQDVGDEHEGYSITLSARYWHPISQRFDISIGASSMYADSSYMRTYFGVSDSDSVRSGLPVFKASSGIRDVSVSPGVVMHLNKSWHLGAALRYQRLLGDAEDSPVVEDRGSADQWVYGLALAYTW